MVNRTQPLNLLQMLTMTSTTELASEMSVWNKYLVITAEQEVLLHELQQNLQTEIDCLRKQQMLLTKLKKSLSGPSSLLSVIEGVIDLDVSIIRLTRSKVYYNNCNNCIQWF